MTRGEETHRLRFSLGALAIVFTVVSTLFAIWAANLPSFMTAIAEFSLLCFTIVWLATRRFTVASPFLLLLFLWILFGHWENYCQSQRANIRVDLLVLYPIFFGLTFVVVLYMCAVLADTWTAPPQSKK